MDARSNRSKMVKNNQQVIDLEHELQWFSQVIALRVSSYSDNEKNSQAIEQLQPPELKNDGSLYGSFVHHYQLSAAERLVLMLALAPHIQPQLLDVFFQKSKLAQHGITEFGGLQGKNHGGFLPTGETALYILAGEDLQQRFEMLKIFERDHIFARHNILKIEAPPAGEPQFSGRLHLYRDYIDYFTTGEIRKPDFSSDFPARLLTTELEWSDLVLEQRVLSEIDELLIWLQHGGTMMKEWDLGKKLRPGFRALFYGPPGTGKTMTASLLGKSTGRDVYRIDLSTVVSKYIGETEKNLSKIFDQAQSKGWILFFDEADALFGTRTKVQDSHDKYANQEVSYLLQRIEDFDGIVILASNMKANLDDAFTRRFESIIHFPMPNKTEREKLWQQGFSKKSKLEKQIDLTAIAEKFELSGGAIMNVIRYCSLMALHRDSTTIKQQDLIAGIRKEFLKEGKTVLQN